MDYIYSISDVINMLKENKELDFSNKNRRHIIMDKYENIHWASGVTGHTIVKLNSDTIKDEYRLISK